MTLAELFEAMIQLGCDSAINLDGGGFTTLDYRNPRTHRLKVLNSPSDKQERAVAEALGMTVQVPWPETNKERAIRSHPSNVGSAPLRTGLAASPTAPNPLPARRSWTVRGRCW